MTTITLHIEGSIEKTLNKLAEQQGITPEQVILDLLKRLDNLQCNVKTLRLWRR